MREGREREWRGGERGKVRGGGGGGGKMPSPANIEQAKAWPVHYKRLRGAGKTVLLVLKTSPWVEELWQQTAHMYTHIIHNETRLNTGRPFDLAGSWATKVDA